MAKISKLGGIDLSSLDSQDMFYIVDSNGDELKSKNLKYETLLSALNRDLEKVQIIEGCSYNKETKTIELSVKLADTSFKVLSIQIEDLNIYHAGDGLSTVLSDDNTFTVDWSKVAKYEHSHEISSTNNLKSTIDTLSSHCGGTTYTAGRGLCLNDTTHEFSTSGDYVTCEDVKRNLSGEYLVTFRDWSTVGE